MLSWLLGSLGLLELLFLCRDQGLFGCWGAAENRLWAHAWERACVTWWRFKRTMLYKTRIEEVINFQDNTNKRRILSCC